MDQELPFLPITVLSQQLASRKLSPVELVQALIQRIEQVDGQLNAFITRTFELEGNPSAVG